MAEKLVLFAKNLSSPIGHIALKCICRDLCDDDGDDNFGRICAVCLCIFQWKRDPNEKVAPCWGYEQAIEVLVGSATE